MRLLKGFYTNKERFRERYLSIYEDIDLLKPIYNYFLQNYDSVTPFSYKEAFEIKDQNIRKEVFNSINITEMVHNLGSTKIAVDGKEVTRENFDKQGNVLPNKTYYAVYETYQINGSALFNEEMSEMENPFLYAVKCWCTSTENEHWIWIDEKYKDSPLEAIASTFHIHKNIIPYIKELKRQGDLMLVELTKEISPSGQKIPLSAEQYFRLLTIET